MSSRTVLDELAGAQGDGLHLVYPHRRDLYEGIVMTGYRRGAAVDPGEQPLGIEMKQIPADRRRAQAECPGERGRADRPIDA